MAMEVREEPGSGRDRSIFTNPEGGEAREHMISRLEILDEGLKRIGGSVGSLDEHFIAFEELISFISA
jgi:hypothetical protein